MLSKLSPEAKQLLNQAINRLLEERGPAQLQKYRLDLEKQNNNENKNEEGQPLTPECRQSQAESSNFGKNNSGKRGNS
jgi:hypothetical protein